MGVQAPEPLVTNLYFSIIKYSIYSIKKCPPVFKATVTKKEPILSEMWRNE